MELVHQWLDIQILYCLSHFLVNQLIVEQFLQELQYNLIKCQLYKKQMYLHCTVMLTLLLSLPILLLAEHVYTPVSSLEASVIVKFTVTLVTFPYPVGTLTLSLIDTLSLKIPLILFHTTVGGG